VVSAHGAILGVCWSLWPLSSLACPSSSLQPGPLAFSLLDSLFVIHLLLCFFVFLEVSCVGRARSGDKGGERKQGGGARGGKHERRRIPIHVLCY
jgi:hypothetical protein